MIKIVKEYLEAEKPDIFITMSFPFFHTEGNLELPHLLKHITNNNNVKIISSLGYPLATTKKEIISHIYCLVKHCFVHKIQNF